MIINGFGGSSGYTGSGDQPWVTLCSFSISGSYTGTMSGSASDKHSYYRLGSSTAFALPNALAFRLVFDSSTKITSGTLSRYSSDNTPTVYLGAYITNTSYTQGLISTSGNWYSNTYCPAAYGKKHYTGSSSTSAAANITTLESAAVTYYSNNEYVYALSTISGIVTSTTGTTSTLTRIFNKGGTYYSYQVGLTAYVSTAIETGYYTGYVTNPAATVAGTLQYIPA